MDREGPPSTERRSHPRRKTDIPARVTLVGRTVDGSLRDIGSGGVCFTTTDPELRVAPGNFVIVSFECVRNGVELTIDRAVRVVHVQDSSKFRVFGLQFEEPLALDDVVLAK